MIVRCAQARRTETPNAVMRTLAAPSSGSTELSVWEVSMAAGSQGPEHRMDREQVWVVLDGELAVELDGESLAATAGDAIILQASASRRMTATSDIRALVASSVAPNVTTAERGTAPLPWAT